MTTLATRSSAWTARALPTIVDARLGEVELERGQPQEQKKDQRRRRGGVADPEVLEPELIDQVAKIVAGLVGAALREDLGRNEEILRAQDESREQDEERRRRQERNGDVPEDVALGGAVHARRLV